MEGGRGHAAWNNPLREQRKVSPAGRLFHGRGSARADQGAFGEKCRRRRNSLYAGGLWVRTSMDPKVQDAAAQALREGLARFDGGRGWRTPGSVSTFPRIGPGARPGAGRRRFPRLAEGGRAVQGWRRSKHWLHHRVARDVAGFGGVDAGARRRRSSVRFPEAGHDHHRQADRSRQLSAALRPADRARGRRSRARPSAARPAAGRRAPGARRTPRCRSRGRGGRSGAARRSARRPAGRRRRGARRGGRRCARRWCAGPCAGRRPAAGPCASIGRSRLNTSPVRTHAAPARARSGVSRPIVPSSSSGPNSPQAEPGGPSVRWSRSR